MTKDERVSRGDVVTAALDLIADGGIEAVTYRKVAARLGISVGALRSRWPTQGTLVAETARVLATELEAGFWPDPPAADPRERAVQALLAQLPRTDEQRHLLVAWRAVLARAQWSDDAEDPPGTWEWARPRAGELVPRILAGLRFRWEQTCWSALRALGMSVEEADAETTGLSSLLEGLRSRLSDPYDEHSPAFSPDEAEAVLRRYLTMAAPR